MSEIEFPTSGVLLGVDYGLARLGLARCDPLRIIASPLAIIKSSGLDPRAVAKLIHRQAKEQAAVGLVFGWPDQDDPRNASLSEAISACIASLEAEGIPVARVFEGFSSRDALELLHSTGKRKKPGQAIDDWAAAVILGRYLGIG